MPFSNQNNMADTHPLAWKLEGFKPTKGWETLSVIEDSPIGNGQYETFKTINMPFVNTVEYSCELNEVAENMFKVIKIEDLYLQIKNFKRITQEEVQKIKDFITNRFKDYTPKKIENSFRKWLHILDNCEKGLPLAEIKYPNTNIESHDKLINYIKSSVFIIKESK